MKKNYGFTLIEVVLVIFLMTLFTFFVSKRYILFIEKKSLERESIKIAMIFRKYQQKSKKEKINIKIYFNFEEKIIVFDKEKVYLNKNFNYLSKNKVDKKIFEREINENGNLNRAFTIVIYSLKTDKKMREISFNSINAISFPIINQREYV